MLESNLALWTDPRASGKSAMDHLFSRLSGMYHATWQNHFGTPEQVDNWKFVWAEAFAEERITPEEVAKALKALLRSNRDFPPSLPVFIEYCRPPIDYGKAFFEAVDQMGRRRIPVTRLVDGEIKTFFEQDTWSNPAVFWAARAMGTDLNKEFRYVGSRWAYELDKVLGGEVLPVPQNTNLLPSGDNTSKELTATEQANIDNMIRNVHDLLNKTAVAE